MYFKVKIGPSYPGYLLIDDGRLGPTNLTKVGATVTLTLTLAPWPFPTWGRKMRMRMVASMMTMMMVVMMVMITIMGGLDLVVRDAGIVPVLLHANIF
jgi:hypothetical protein